MYILAFIIAYSDTSHCDESDSWVFTFDIVLFLLDNSNEKVIILPMWFNIAF